MADKAATPWGQAAIVDEVVIAQTADGKEFSSIVQLLEASDGGRLVRFAYSTDGTSRRGPVTLRADDVATLRRALGERPALAEALGFEGSEQTRAGASSRRKGGGRGAKAS